MDKKFETPDEEMSVSIELEDGFTVECSVVTILEVEGKDYIVLLPGDTAGRFPDDEVWFYGYRENPDDPNEEPELIYIEDDEEYEKVSEAFDEYQDELDFLIGSDDEEE